MSYQLLFAIKHALRGINRRKLKNVINTLGILIGVSLLAGVQVATDSLVNAMQETVSLRYGNADIAIQKGEYQLEFFNYSVYENLKNDPTISQYIDGIAPRITSSIGVISTITDQTEPIVTILGIDEELDKEFGNFVLDNQYGNNDYNFSDLGYKQCFIGNGLSDSLIDFDIDDSGLKEIQVLPAVIPIQMLYINAQGNFSFYTLQVKGVVDISGKGVLDAGNAIFVKLDQAQEIFNISTSKINNIVVSTTLGNDNALNVTALLEENLVAELGAEDGGKYNVDPQKHEAFREVAASIKSFRIVLYVFGSLIIISGILLILNITMMNIDERQRSIGILRAIGMTQKQLLTTLITESVILGGVGSLLGVGGGLLNGLMIIFLLENFLNIGEILRNIPLVVNPAGLIISFAIGVLIASLAAIYPAWKASRMDIVDTINEIQSEKVNKRSGDWAIYLGITLLIAGITALTLSLLITPDWRWMMFIGSVLGILMGLGFALARFINPKLAYNGFALSWMLAGLMAVLVLNPYLTEIGVQDDQALYAFLIGMLGLVFGTIIFVALNLEWLSDRFNDIFQKVKSTRALGIISMRYIGKKKTRSALTFAIFGVILTMNVFLAVFTGSFTLGFADFAENEEGGVDIIAYQPFPISSDLDDPIELIKSADENIEEVVGMRFLFSLAGAVTYIKFTAVNATGTYEFEVPIPTDMWGINQEFLNMTEYKFVEVWDEIEGDPWVETMDATNNYVILPGLLREFSYDDASGEYFVNQTVGDVITIPQIDFALSNETHTVTILSNYTIAAFVETTSYSMLFSAFLFTSEDSPIFAPIGYNDTAFLISVDSKLNTDQIVEISHKIEAQLDYFDTISLRHRIESLLELISQSINFMQAFVSLGLVVGVLGLIVVSLRGITERTREIGMMRALGFQRAEVITAVVIEIFAVALVGLVIGVINGFVLGYGMYTQYLMQYDFNFIIPWGTLGIFIGITILLSIISAVLPARRASKIPPSDALRYTG